MSPQCPITKCSVLVCWLGRESLQAECIGLVKELWTQGIAADLVYESLELDSIEDIQDFCRRNYIPHVVILSDKALFFERKQVKVRTLESGKVTEKIVNISELVESLQQRHNVDRSDPLETREGGVRTGGSYGVDPQSNVMPPVNVNIVGMGKLPGHLKRRYHDQVRLLACLYLSCSTCLCQLEYVFLICRLWQNLFLYSTNFHLNCP